ncbi:MAG: IS3 family transposase [Saprospiraceae bacterium]|nr:IS3 family transposase [Saprospiraceae bacterium]MBK9271492.1 IS3 family transposase [Saprospiraceae bacterium]
MKEQNLKAIQPKSFVPKTTDSTGTKFPAPNLLLDFGKAQKPNEVWVGDITYIPLKNGQWAYLSTWIDTYLHKVVGWDVQTHMRSELVISAFNKAKLKCIQNKLSVIVHSDRGTQYSSKDFKNAIKGNRQSMTRKNEVYDNAIAESFFSRLKCECIRGTVFDDLDQLRFTLFEYIDGYYNTIRRHSSIQYYTPLEFENIYYSKNQFTHCN